MSATHQLTEFADRKRLLVLQTDLHRTVLRAECVNVRARLSWLNETRHKARFVGPWLAVGTAAVGFFVAWRRHRLTRWIPTVLAPFRAWRELKSY